MRTLTRSWLSPLRAAASAILLLWPLLAQAEERGPDELGHFIAVLTVFGVFFLTGCSFVIWLLVSRLRGSAQLRSDADLGAPPASLDSLWFPAAAAVPSRPRLPR